MRRVDNPLARKYSEGGFCRIISKVTYRVWDNLLKRSLGALIVLVIEITEMRRNSWHYGGGNHKRGEYMFRILFAALLLTMGIFFIWHLSFTDVIAGVAALGCFFALVVGEGTWDWPKRP